MNNIECESCIKRKTIYCPNSSECYETENKPYWQNRIMLLEENKRLKEVITDTYDTGQEIAGELSKENKSLRTRIKTIKRRRKHQTQKLNKYKAIITDLQNALIKKNNKIDKAIGYIEQEIYYCLASGDNINIYLDKLLEILKGESND